MSAFGKVLAVLNIIAVGAFLFIAAMDYSRFKNWTYAIASVDRKLEGEPVDKNDIDVEGNVKSQDLDDYTLKTLPQLSGKPLTEQEAEVKDVERKLRGKVESAEAIEVSGDIKLN